MTTRTQVKGKAIKPKISMWGAGGKLTMKEIVRDLRDKNDR